MDTLTVAERSARMSLIRGKDTGPELALRRMVWAMGYRYRKHPRHLPGRPDLAFPRLRKVIFVHGCFWHRHRCALGRLPKSKLDFWETKLEKNRRRDIKVISALAEAGWQAMVVWECELGDTAGVADRIRNFLDA